MKKYLVIFALLFAQYGFAQTVWKAKVPVVDESGYYNIELNQELIGAGLAYLKIFDEQNGETPYFIRSTDPVLEVNNFESYKLERNVIKDSINIVVVDNRSSENMNRFCLVLQEAEAEKFAVVRGSNDMKQWYIVKQETKALRVGRQVADNTELLIIDFPQGNYRYYEITLRSNNSSPLDVLKVGKIKNSNLYGKFVEIGNGKFINENKSENNTDIRFPDIRHRYCINKIEFGIKNKPDYLRQALLIDSLSYDTERLYLSSERDNVFFINDFYFSPRTHVIIKNQNNPSLAIDSIKIYGLCRYACVYLEAGKKYNLVSDSRDFVSSKYDIEHFRDKISADLPLLQLENLNYDIIPEEIVPERELSFIEQPAFLWGMIIVVGAFLVFICFRMIREMKSK